MARVQELIVRKAPPAPPAVKKPQKDLDEIQREALEADPTILIVDRVFETEESVQNAAFRVNAGHRTSWPNDRYFAIWEYKARAKYSVRGEDNSITSKTGGYELLIGVRPHIPEGWESKVNIRRRRSSAQGSLQGSQQDDGEQMDDGPEGEEHAAA